MNAWDTPELRKIAKNTERIAAALERIAAVFETTDSADMAPAQPEVSGVRFELD